jgi:small acid-soluble spore protein D (minor alpha/beta-type SASP)
MARRGERLLSPEVLDAFKFEVAEDLGIPLRRGDNGDLRTRDAGAIGGRIGGRMVRILVRYAESTLLGEPS